MSIRTLYPILTAAMVMVAGTTAVATHIPTALDDPNLWSPLPGNDGYLDFMTPAPNAVGPFTAVDAIPLPPGVIASEEFTGWTNLQGNDFLDGADQDPWAGDRADFDWVQENRPVETAAPPGGFHPGFVGAMGWQIAPTQASPHFDGPVPPGTGAHNHGGTPTLINNDYHPMQNFNAVDVFSIISVGQDSDSDAAGLWSPRESALDYEVWFVDFTTLTSTVGVPIKVFVPGWTAAATADDYVARWVPKVPGLWDGIAIEPSAAVGHDQVTEIDAIKAYEIPEPATLALFGLGALAAMRRRRRR